MKVLETNLKRCFVIETPFLKDKRGFFLIRFNQATEFEKETGIKTNFVLDNQYNSQHGVLRGLQMQKGEFSQAKLERVAEEKVLYVVVDIRKNSETSRQSLSTELSGENNKQLFVPRGFAHGFAVLEDNTIFFYNCDNYYHKASEGGIIYNDESLNIDWILNEEEAILSEKDKCLKNFNQLQD